MLLFTHYQNVCMFHFLFFMNTMYLFVYFKILSQKVCPRPPPPFLKFLVKLKAEWELQSTYIHFFLWIAQPVPIILGSIKPN